MTTRSQRKSQWDRQRLPHTVREGSLGHSSCHETKNNSYRSKYGDSNDGTVDGLGDCLVCVGWNRTFTIFSHDKAKSKVEGIDGVF